MMRIQLASDLHLEFLRGYFPGERLIAPAHQADVLVLAGDIEKGTAGVELFSDWTTPVLYVLGNHEFYGRNPLGYAFDVNVRTVRDMKFENAQFGWSCVLDVNGTA